MLDKLNSDVKWFPFTILVCVTVVLGTKTEVGHIIFQDVTVTAGGDAQLFCQLAATIQNLTSVTWRRRTLEKPTNTDFFASDGKAHHINGLRDRVKFTGNLSELISSVRLSNVIASDEGIYTCIFSVLPHGLYKGEIYLRVLVPPVVSVSTDVPPVAGDTEEILATCTAANATPAAEVSWSLGALNESVKVQMNITEDSEGRYTLKSSLIGVASRDLNRQKVQCLVTHPGLKQKLELNHTLNIHYPPQEVHIIVLGGQGETCKFHCEADANPKPSNFTWSRHFPVKEPLSSNVNGSILTTHSNGLYYCVASNQYGNAVGFFNETTCFTAKEHTCWIVPIIAALVVCFLIWKFILRQHVRKRLWCFQDYAVPTDSSAHSNTDSESQ